jgi:hypothetical protein
VRACRFQSSLHLRLSHRSGGQIGGTSICSSSLGKRITLRRRMVSPRGWCLKKRGIPGGERDTSVLHEQFEAYSAGFEKPRTWEDSLDCNVQDENLSEQVNKLKPGQSPQPNFVQTPNVPASNAQPGHETQNSESHRSISNFSLYLRFNIRTDSQSRRHETFQSIGLPQPRGCTSSCH